jgi:hypothetical protein
MALIFIRHLTSLSIPGNPNINIGNTTYIAGQPIEILGFPDKKKETGGKKSDEVFFSFSKI